jgi:copper chaperone NosL
MEPDVSRPPQPIARRSARLPLVATLVAVALAPGPAPAALDAGRPACDYCRMLLEDPQFGAELTLGSGRKKIYDTVECMASAVLTDSVAVSDVRTLTLVDHARPGNRVPIDRAVFLHCPEIASPMGQSLLAFRTSAEADSTCPSPRGTRLDWRGVLTQVNATWFQGKLAVEPHVKFPRLKTSTSPKH